VVSAQHGTCLEQHEADLGAGHHQAPGKEAIGESATDENEIEHGAALNSEVARRLMFLGKSASCFSKKPFGRAGHLWGHLKEDAGRHEPHDALL
jgi:hypothetical protein